MSQRLESGKDTGRTLGWKVILQAAQNAREKGKAAEAEDLFGKVLRIVEKRLPADDLRIAYILLEVSEFYVTIKKQKESEECFDRARAIMKMHANKLDSDEFTSV